MPQTRRNVAPMVITFAMEVGQEPSTQLNKEFKGFGLRTVMALKAFVPWSMKFFRQLEDHDAFVHFAESTRSDF